ncbi:MAG: HPr family phosphocarrier protein [Coriobacteriia bacterium]|nr:HPr family phosphocarrier protein [Coriobacteriia bacterium]
MQTFEYTIKDSLGIHVRPAGQLAQLAKEKKSTITIKLDDKEADTTKLFAVMALAVKCGNTITVTVDGEDEEEAAAEVKKFLEENL